MTVNVLLQSSSRKETSKSFDYVKQKRNVLQWCNWFPQWFGMEGWKKRRTISWTYFKHWGASLFTASTLKNCVTKSKQGKCYKMALLFTSTYKNLIFNIDMQKHFAHFGLFWELWKNFLLSSSVTNIFGHMDLQ